MLDGQWSDSALRTLGRSSVAVDVRHGTAYRRGHASTSLHRQRVTGLATVPGVTASHNQLTADRDRVAAVAQALAEHPLTRPHPAGVGVFHGWVRLGGWVRRAVVVPAEWVMQAGDQVVRLNARLASLAASGVAAVINELAVRPPDEGAGRQPCCARRPASGRRRALT